MTHSRPKCQDVSWYKKPSDADLRRVQDLSRGTKVAVSLRTGLGSNCRDTILAMERQINGGKQLSKTEAQ